MKSISFEGKRHLEAALRRRQAFQAHAYSVDPFALPVFAVALVAPGRSLSAEGRTPRRGGASALARIRWPEEAKGKVSGDSCEPHPFPTWLHRPGEEHRLPVPVAGVVGSGRRGVGVVVFARLSGTWFGGRRELYQRYLETTCFTFFVVQVLSFILFIRAAPVC